MQIARKWANVKIICVYSTQRDLIFAFVYKQLTPFELNDVSFIRVVSYGVILNQFIHQLARTYIEQSKTELSMGWTQYCPASLCFASTYLINVCLPLVIFVLLYW